MNRKKWLYSSIVLLLWLCVGIGDLQVGVAEEIVGGQVMTEGQITFDKETKPVTPTRPTGPDGNAYSEKDHSGVSSNMAKPVGRFPSMGEQLIKNSLWLGIVLVSIVVLVYFTRKGRRNE